MGNLFGIRRRAPQVTAQDRAILQLKQQRDKIKIYQKRTEADLEKNKDLALKLFQNGMRERALIVMKRKKNMEDVLARTDKQLETLEQLLNDIEYTQIEVSVVEGLRVGTEALKQLNNLMNIDDIQQMMEDNVEAAEKQREISQILQQSSERYDDDELAKELENIIESQKPASSNVLDDQILDKVTDAEFIMESRLEDLPDVPESKPRESEKKRTPTKPREDRRLESAQ